MACGNDVINSGVIVLWCLVLRPTRERTSRRLSSRGDSIQGDWMKRHPGCQHLESVTSISASVDMVTVPLALKFVLYVRGCEDVRRRPQTNKQTDKRTGRQTDRLTGANERRGRPPR